MLERVIWLESDDGEYRVVVNHEGQYSVLRSDVPNPPGWNDAGMEGPKPECLDFVTRVWTDMRPVSLRTSMAPPSE